MTKSFLPSLNSELTELRNTGLYKSERVIASKQVGIVLVSGKTVRLSSFEWIISIRKLSQYRSNRSDSAAADLLAFVSDFVGSDNSIFCLLKRCRRSDGVAREK